MSHFLSLLGAISLVLVTTFPGVAGTAVLRPVADTSLNEAVAAANLGANPNLVAGTVNTGKKSRALLRFDLAGAVPDGAMVTSVSLSLTVVRVNSDVSPTSQFGLHRMKVAWNEGNKSGNLGANATAAEPSWNVRSFPNTTWQTPGGAPDVDYVASASTQERVAGLGSYRLESTLQLIEDVHLWLLHPDANFGWILISDAEQTPETARRFGSREDPSNAPLLTIEYQLPLTLTQIELDLTRSSVSLVWENGAPNYQVQSAETLNGPWADAGPSQLDRHIVLPVSGERRFYRVLSQLPP